MKSNQFLAKAKKKVETNKIKSRKERNVEYKQRQINWTRKLGSRDDHNYHFVKVNWHNKQSTVAREIQMRLVVVGRR